MRQVLANVCCLRSDRWVQRAERAEPRRFLSARPRRPAPRVGHVLGASWRLRVLFMRAAHPAAREASSCRGSSRGSRPSAYWSRWRKSPGDSAYSATALPATSWRTTISRSSTCTTSCRRSLRKQLLGAILVRYGLVLPLLERIPPTKKLLTKLRITRRPPGLRRSSPYSSGSSSSTRSVTPESSSSWAWPWRFCSRRSRPPITCATIRTRQARRRRPFGCLRDWHREPRRHPRVRRARFGHARQLSAEPVVVEVAATEIRAIERDLRNAHRA